jgi:hypothetical protein
MIFQTCIHTGNTPVEEVIIGGYRQARLKGFRSAIEVSLFFEAFTKCMASACKLGLIFV